MKFYVRRIGNTLVPDGTESANELARLPFGKPLRCDATVPRSGPHHRLYFSLCARIAAGIGQETEWVSRAFKIEQGYYDLYKTIDGRECLVPRSISFSAMSQTEFSAFWERCLQIMYERWRIDPASVADLLVPEEAQKTR